MFKKLIIWSEEEPTRARKIMLFSVVFSFIILTFIILIACFFKLKIINFLSFYSIYAGIAGIAIGFYTGTNANSDKIENLTNIFKKVEKNK